MHKEGSFTAAITAATGIAPGAAFPSMLLGILGLLGIAGIVHPEVLPLRS